MCPNLGNSRFLIQWVSELSWCTKLAYFAENRWFLNINGVLKYIVNMVFKPMGITVIHVSAQKPPDDHQGHSTLFTHDQCFLKSTSRVYCTNLKVVVKVLVLRYSYSNKAEILQ